MKNVLVTQEEEQFILRRRELAAKRKKLQNAAPKNPVQPAHKPKDAVTGTNRPAGWDSHCDPCKIHKGRITDTHPLYWFEEEIFKKIGNIQHKDQHKKITTLLKMPVQNVYRDRQYHALIHLDALWEQELLPLKYKIRYEQYKKDHGIGDDNVHPAHKTEKPDYKHPIPVKTRAFDLDNCPACNENEQFIAGKKYIYAA